MKHGITLTVKAEADANVDTVELQCGGLIIFPQVRLTMTVGDKTYNITDKAIDDGMRSIRNNMSWYDE